jgi:hypothetical protein
VITVEEKTKTIGIRVNEVHHRRYLSLTPERKTLIKSVVTSIIDGAAIGNLGAYGAEPEPRESSPLTIDNTANKNDNRTDNMSKMAIGVLSILLVGTLAVLLARPKSPSTRHL